MKIVLMLLTALLLSGCHQGLQDSNNIRDTGYPTISVICINGVVYYNAYNRIAVAMNPDSTVKTCTNGVSDHTDN